MTPPAPRQSMAWVRVVPEEQAQGDLKQAYARVRGQRGRVANVISVTSLLPAVMERAVDFYLSLMFGHHKLPRAQREMVAVEVSRANRCAYCVEHHAAALERVTRDPTLADAMRRGVPHPARTPQDEVMLAYARKLALQPWDIGQGDVEALRKAGLDDEEVVAVNHIVGYFSMMNRIVLGLGVDIEQDKGADPAYKY